MARKELRRGPVQGYAPVERDVVDMVGVQHRDARPGSKNMEADSTTVSGGGKLHDRRRHCLELYELTALTHDGRRGIAAPFGHLPNRARSTIGPDIEQLRLRDHQVVVRPEECRRVTAVVGDLVEDRLGPSLAGVAVGVGKISGGTLKIEAMPAGQVVPAREELATAVEAGMVDGVRQTSPDDATAEAWLAKMDSNKAEILPLFAATYGADQAVKWWAYWRVFYMACAELWDYDDGNEWFVSHYLFRNPGR